MKLNGTEKELNYCGDPKVSSHFNNLRMVCVRGKSLIGNTEKILCRSAEYNASNSIISMAALIARVSVIEIRSII